MKVYINNELTTKLPDFDIIANLLDVTVRDSDMVELVIHQVEQEIIKQYTLEEVLTIPLIKQARDAYKKLGKDPSRYRLAVESLLRRLVKGNLLYRINNVVDIGNILSIKTLRSVCVADADKISGDVSVRIGTSEDVYEGINRGILNIENIPVYQDDVSAFGTTTSDSPRTAITNQTTRVLVMIICFGHEYKEENKVLLKQLYSSYASSKKIIDLEVIRK